MANDSKASVCLALLWQHTACSRPEGRALVSCTSPVHPVLSSMHVEAAAQAIIGAYWYIFKTSSVLSSLPFDCI